MKSIHKYLFLIGVVFGCKNVFFSMDCNIYSENLCQKLTIPEDFNPKSVFEQLDLNCKQQYRTYDQTSTQPLVKIKTQRPSSCDSKDNLFDKTTQASTAKETYEESYNGSDDTKKFLENTQQKVMDQDITKPSPKKALELDHIPEKQTTEKQKMFSDQRKKEDFIRMFQDLLNQKDINAFQQETQSIITQVNDQTQCQQSQKFTMQIGNSTITFGITTILRKN